MNPQDLNPTIDVRNILNTEKFLHLKGFFVIDYPCIFTEDKIVKAQEEYDLLDFTDNHGGLHERQVRFWTAMLKGYNLKIVVLDTKTGELIHRSHRLDNEDIPCDWLLIEKDYFHPKNSEKNAALDFCDDNNPQHGN